ncbi:MAG: hypothetical protein WBV46_09960 [Terriglobales bacterium]
MRLAAIAKFACILCVLCASSLFAAALDREAFTVTKYDLEIRLEPDQQRLGARGKITLRNDSAQPQQIVALQISSSLDWRAIRAADKALQFVSQPFTSDIDHTGALSEAIVTLPAEIKPKDSVELEVGYEGVIPLDATRLARVGVPDAIARHTSWDHIGASFTAVRGAGYVAWYPITSESADFSEGNSLFEVTDRLRAREAGSEFHVNIHVDGDGNQEMPVVVCSSADPSWIEATGVQRSGTTCSLKSLGTAVPTFAVARYKSSYKDPLNLFSLPDHESGAATYAEAFDPATTFVTEWFGKPRAPIAIADLADPHAAPFESGTLLMVSMEGEDTKQAGINLVHELVHSAFASPRPWVYEGLAHFAEAAYREQQGGRSAALDLLASHRAAFLDAEKTIPGAPVKDIGPPLAATFDEIYYRSKAAYVWWMLRDMAGQDALKAAIAKYKAEDDRDPKYVEGLIEAAAKRDLAWFFEDWVYHDRGLPDVRVLAVHPWEDDKPGDTAASEKRARMITVTLENSGNAGAEVPFTVRCAGSEVSRRLEVRAKSTATMRVELSEAPIEVAVNDGSVPEDNVSNNVFKISSTDTKPK